MAKLSLKSIVGNVGKGLNKVQFLKNQAGQLESMLGSKPQYLLIGALQEVGKVNQWVENNLNFYSLGDKMLNRLSEDYKQDGVVVDAIVDYQGEMSVTLTKNPVQKKADVSDHRIPQPKTLTIELGVSNDVVTDIMGQAKKVVAGYASLLGWNLDDRRILTYKSFEQLMLRGKPFTVITPHGIYENMLITKVRPHTTLETQGLFYGTVEFQEIIFFEEIKGQNTSPQAYDFKGELANMWKNSLKAIQS